jgi:hypothetical protein
LIQQRPYLEMQALFDPMNPPGRRYYNKAHNISTIQDGVIDTVIQYMETAPTPSTMVAFQQLHGAAARVAADETAFPHRYDHHVVWINPIGDDPADDQRMIRWGRECWQGLPEFEHRAGMTNANT